MLVDQNGIDTLLAEAAELTEEAAPEQTPPQPPSPECAPPGLHDPRIARLLRIRVPVIVRLATRPMVVRAIRTMAPGAIIEFDKSVEDDLDLLINNRPIGAGVCVKIGEHFGIRLSRILDKSQRIQSLGA